MSESVLAVFLHKPVTDEIKSHFKVFFAVLKKTKLLYNDKGSGAKIGFGKFYVFAKNLFPVKPNLGCKKIASTAFQIGNNCVPIAIAPVNIGGGWAGFTGFYIRKYGYKRFGVVFAIVKRNSPGGSQFCL